MRIIGFVCFVMIVLSSAVRAGDEPFTIYIGDVPPFNYVNDQGVADGIGVMVMDEVMRKIGAPINVEDIQVISWPRAVDDTENNPGTMLIGMAWTSQRSKRFKWVGPIGTFRLGLVAKKEENITINSPEDIRQYLIGVIRGSAPIHILEDKYGVSPSQMHMLLEDPQMFKMLDAGRVDLITQADTAAPSGIRAAGLMLNDFEMVFTLRQLDLYAVFNKATDDAFIQKAQEAFDAMKVKPKGGLSPYEKIQQKYMKDGVIKIH